MPEQLSLLKEIFDQIEDLDKSISTITSSQKADDATVGVLGLIDQISALTDDAEQL